MLKQKPSQDMYLEVMTVTPEQAAKWLEFNEGNRPPKKSRVDFLVRELQSGNWRMNAETIKFAPNGRLLDGQHRLKACMLSGVEMKSLVAFNVPEDTFTTIDTGVVRNGADVLHVAGFDNSGPLRAAIAVHINYESGDLYKSGRPRTRSNTDFVKFAKENDSFVADFNEVRSFKIALSKVMPFAAPSGLYHLMKQANKQKAKDFIQILAHGYCDGYEGNNPAILLRNKMMHIRAQGYRIPQSEQANLITVAWNAFVDGRNISVLRAAKAVERLEVRGAKK